MTTGLVWSAALVGVAAVVWSMPHASVRRRARQLLGVRPSPWQLVAARVRQVATKRKASSRRVIERRAGVVQRFVEAVVVELESGLPPTVALRAAAERHRDDPTIGRLAGTLTWGGEPTAALREAAAEPGADALWAVAVCYDVTSRSGAALADALRPICEGLRSEQELRREINGQLAAPLATARLLAGLPVFVWLLGYTLGTNPVRTLFTTPYGLACLVIGVGLEFAGLRWVRTMARRAVGS